MRLLFNVLFIDEVRLWANCSDTDTGNNYFVYQPGQGDVDSQFVHIVNSDKPTSIVKLSGLP